MAFSPSKEMLAHCEENLKLFARITEQLSLPEVISKREQFMNLSKERSSLEEIVGVFTEFKKKFSDYEGARKILEEENDPDLREMAQLDIATLEPELENTANKIQLMLLPKDPNDDKNIVLELRAGVGGDEASIFVGDLFRSYVRYAEDHKWRWEILSGTEGTAGGYKEIIAEISGESVYSKLKYESGVHRVQRVPKTEGSGRIHTSTITVAIMPEAEEVDLVIEDKELRIDVFRSGGKGGQSVNTTDSAVRITYLPTNEVVICQDEKSQLKNKNKAMKILRSRILEKKRQAQHDEQMVQRRSQVGGGFRNERIRTYNFPQGRVSDHRIGMTTYNIDEVINGKLDPFIEALTNYYQTMALKGESPEARPLAQSEDD